MSNDETTRPVMGYAPVGCPQPFPPPQQGYYGHPYTAYPNYYNGAGPPPGTVYYSSAQLPNISPQPSKDFKVESFNVPYFDIANSTLKARWETNITVKSTNQKSRISFPHIQGYLVYRNRLVDAAMIDPLHLEGKTEASLRANFSLPDPRGNLPEASVVDAMGEGRKIGILDFYLRLDMRATYVSGSYWSRETMLRVICGDLWVNFPAPIGGGTWNGTSGECSTYY